MSTRSKKPEIGWRVRATITTGFGSQFDVEGEVVELLSEQFILLTDAGTQRLIMYNGDWKREKDA